jgi:hypothetical protein
MAAEEIIVIKSGHMSKQGELWKSWKRRYFKLTKNVSSGNPCEFSHFFCLGKNAILIRFEILSLRNQQQLSTKIMVVFQLRTVLVCLSTHPVPFRNLKKSFLFHTFHLCLFVVLQNGLKSKLTTCFNVVEVLLNLIILRMNLPTNVKELFILKMFLLLEH